MATVARRAKKRERTGEDYVRRTISLPPDLDAKLEQAAQDEERPVSNLLARVLREWFAGREEKRGK